MKKENIKKILLLFIAIQPLLDIYYLYEFSGVNSIFIFSPATIIRLIFCIILLYMSFKLIMTKDEKKLLTFYCILCTIYGLLQFVFYKNIETYSFSKEVFYLIRMFFPLEILFITYKNKLPSAKIEKALYVSALIFSSIMIVTNLTLIAIPSYEYYHHISSNFISWFFDYGNKYDFYQIASKGIFHMANQISAVTVLLLPILLCYFYKKANYTKFIIILGFILSMLMIGSKTASYGVLIISIIMSIIYLFMVVIKKELAFNKKTVILSAIILVYTIFIYSYAPIQRRVVEGNGDKDEVLRLRTEMLKDIEEYENTKNISKLKTEMEDYLLNFAIDPKYYNEVYLIEDKTDFWIKTIKLPIDKMKDSRKIQLQITKDVYSDNYSLKTLLFGLTFSQSRNSGIYIERDFIAQFYSLGLIGLILLISPYILIIIYSIYKILRNFKTKFTLLNISYLFGICITIMSSILSGNVLDELIVTIYLGFTSGILLNDLGEKNED